MYGFKSSVNFETSEECDIAKARQENLNKNWLGSSNVPVELLNVFTLKLVQSKREVLEKQSSELLLLMTTQIIVGVL
jgi:hypothetical protein